MCIIAYINFWLCLIRSAREIDMNLLEFQPPMIYFAKCGSFDEQKISLPSYIIDSGQP